MNFLVVGAGAWGTAFAVHLARAGRTVALVPRRAEQAAQLAKQRENLDYLPGVPLPSGILIEEEIGGVLSASDVILLACPSQALRETCARLRDASTDTKPKWVVSLAKGLELGTHLRPSEIIELALPKARAAA